MLTLYGIKNCDTVKKARRWLQDNGVDYRFHDLRDDGITQQQIADWIAQAGTDALLNKRSTTWRTLSDTEKTIQSDKQAVALLHQHPTLIKRPVLENGSQLLVGFKPELYQQHIKQA